MMFAKRDNSNEQKLRIEVDCLRDQLQHRDEVIAHYREALQSFAEGYRARFAEDQLVATSLARPKGDGG